MGEKGEGERGRREKKKKVRAADGGVDAEAWLGRPKDSAGSKKSERQNGARSARTGQAQAKQRKSGEGRWRLATAGIELERDGGGRRGEGGACA